MTNVCSFSYAVYRFLRALQVGLTGNDDGAEELRKNTIIEFHKNSKGKYLPIFFIFPDCLYVTYLLCNGKTYSAVIFCICSVLVRGRFCRKFFTSIHQFAGNPKKLVFIVVYFAILKKKMFICEITKQLS